MEAVKIKEGVYWVGAIDHNIRNFHGYITPHGTTYNAYLIVDEKTALIDTVKAPFKDELIARVSSVVDPASIDYLIINHVEMDHSGSAVAVMGAAKDAKVVATEKGRDFLHGHYHVSPSWHIQPVGQGDTIKLGKRTLQFIPAPMLHWPDTMFTYAVEDRVLFSNDGFGQHIATSQRFFDEIGDRDVLGEAQKYYANILLPYSRLVQKKLAELNMEIQIICPSHGVIFRKKKDIDRIIALYRTWAEGVTKEKAVIAYDTMYSSTEKMARAIEEGLTKEGIDVKFFNLRVSDWSEIMKEVLDARAVIVGSPTLNNNPMPTVGGFLTYLKGLRPRGKIGAAFGSYGWGGGATKTISEYLKATGFELPLEDLQARFVPDASAIEMCGELGKSMAQHIKEG